MMFALRNSSLRASNILPVRPKTGSFHRYYATERRPLPIQQPAVEVFSGPSARRKSSRQYVTEIPRPPPPPPSKEPAVETFADTSKLRPYYVKHPPFRDLPKAKSKWPILLAALAVGLSGWAAFYAYATNQEKLSSSVFRSIVRAVKSDPQLRGVLGEAIRPQPEWYLNGDPLISGRISQIQGNIDVSFRVRGSKGSGTLYFTSIRKDKGAPFTVLRFRVICDDGTTVNISDTPGV